MPLARTAALVRPWPPGSRSPSPSICHTGPALQAATLTDRKGQGSKFWNQRSKHLITWLIFDPKLKTHLLSAPRSWQAVTAIHLPTPEEGAHPSPGGGLLKPPGGKGAASSPLLQGKGSYWVTWRKARRAPCTRGKWTLCPPPCAWAGGKRRGRTLPEHTAPAPRARLWLAAGKTYPPESTSRCGGLP